MMGQEYMQELIRKVSALERRVKVLEQREDMRSGAKPEVVRAVHNVSREAAERFGVDAWLISGGTTRGTVSRARQWVMFEVRERHGFSYPDIGDAMGRDHSTIISGCHEERIRRAKALPDMEDSAKIERAEKGRQPQSGSNRNRDLDGGAQHG